MEEWTQINEFPGYSISSHGRVRNEDTGRLLALLRNQQGIVHVGLMRGLTQFKRSVVVLVANYFLPPSKLEAFDTPIQLDGDRSNANVQNLMWRPRWFAIRYHRQFHRPNLGIVVPIRETRTGEEFDNSWEAAIKYGLIDKEILDATLNRTYVWPTYQTFEVIE